MRESWAVDDPIGPASHPFGDACTTALISRHHNVVTRALVDGDGPVPVPEGREGNFAARDHNNRGQLAPHDVAFTALCVAHSYGVMHYSEMLSFLRSLPEVPRWGPVVGLDLGCGIGSALLALRAAVGESPDHRWMGFDANGATLAIARDLFAGLAGPRPRWVTALDEAVLDQVALWALEGRRLVVTASHLFGQQSLTSTAIEDLARQIGDLVTITGSIELVGIEPDRSGVVERGPQFLAELGRWTRAEARVDEVRELLRLETRSTAPIPPMVGPCRKRVRWYSLGPARPASAPLTP